MKEIRNIVDGGGNSREMELRYDRSGTMIYTEVGTGVVAAFLEYDSKDESAVWSEDLDRLADDYPQLSSIVAEIIKAA